jgi:hypothetical protein
MLVRRGNSILTVVHVTSVPEAHTARLIHGGSVPPVVQERTVTVDKKVAPTVRQAHGTPTRELPMNYFAELVVSIPTHPRVLQDVVLPTPSWMRTVVYVLVSPGTWALTIPRAGRVVQAHTRPPPVLERAQIVVLIPTHPRVLQVVPAAVPYRPRLLEAQAVPAMGDTRDKEDRAHI